MAGEYDSPKSGSAFRRKFSAFLDKKKQKTISSMKRNVEKLKPLEEEILQRKINRTDPEVNTIYTRMHQELVHTKCLAMDRRTLPEYISKSLEEEIQRQRYRAMDRAKTMSLREARRLALEIQGENFAIPEWMIVRDTTLLQTYDYGMKTVSFPKQFPGEIPRSLREMSEHFWTTAPNAGPWSELRTQGFENSSPRVIATNYKPGEELRFFPKNFLEASRLNKNWFFALYQANARDIHPVLTLRNRAKRAEPIYTRGLAARPFYFEIGGITYACEGDYAGIFLIEFLMKKEPMKFFLACAISALRRHLTPEDIIPEVWDFTPPEAKPPPVVPKPRAEQWLIPMEIAYPFWNKARVEDVDQLFERKLIGRSEREFALALCDGKAPALPRTSDFILLMDVESRQKLYPSALEKEKKENEMLINYLYEYLNIDYREETLESFNELGKSALDELSEDEEGGLFGFMSEGEDETPPEDSRSSFARETDERTTEAGMGFDEELPELSDDPMGGMFGDDDDSASEDQGERDEPITPHYAPKDELESETVATGRASPSYKVFHDTEFAEEYSIPGSDSEDETSPIVDDDDGAADLGQAGPPSKVITGERIETEPQLISEVRLYPHSRKYWKPP